MSRECPWRSQCPEIVRCRQLQALYGPTLFLVRRPGPLSLVLRATAAAKPIKVHLSGRHFCSCRTFISEKELCVHLCWAILRLFRLSPTNPLSFQLGMVERETSTILKTAVPMTGLASRALIFNQLPSPSEISRILPNLEPEKSKLPSVEPRPLTQQDACPICLEPLLQKPQPVTHCRYSCGNHVHIRCMKIWIKHNCQDEEIGLKIKVPSIKCPVCRGVFNYESEMKLEFQNAPKTKAPPLPPLLPAAAPGDHKQQGDDGVMALLDSLLASQHNQEVRNERSSSEGITNSEATASSSTSTVATACRIREIITPVAVSVLVRALPEWKIPPRHRLLSPGHQCCLCLRHYETGETVSGLQCGHEFHAECLSPWLQRNSSRSRGARCPIDHADLTPWLTERLIAMQRTASREPPPAGKAGGRKHEGGLTLRSSRLTLINRLHQHPHSCGHLPTPPPSTCPSPPPPPAPSSENSRPSSGGRRVRLAAQQSEAVLHLVSLSLPKSAEATTGGGWAGGGNTSRRRLNERGGHRHCWTREETPRLEINCTKISLKVKT
ncbi:E3 ubiquitin-protein ligase Zswim2-like [Neocloeon triangulifer]|uniref:E3 ubiquitin-protein ligase Zswim2-like n=1 Tax=Neocloeon triangulifer TaxID=2078957 RepID=UPI00286EF579|nr:E3 ubiquitin-protein ligase Zswim2-like [Neocloeon triangulifer]